MAKSLSASAFVCNSSEQIVVPSSKSKFDLSSLLIRGSGNLTSKNREPRFVILAQEFKYKENSSKKDIEIIRKLLTAERALQNEKDYKFWTSDYERMMQDDWLVSRFLIRGTKQANKIKSSGSLELSDDNEAEQQAKFDCTMKLVRACAKYRQDYRIDGHTKLSEFPIEWTHLNGLMSYKPDLVGNPTIYLRTKLHRPKLIETKELRHEFKRLLLYTLECCDRDLYNKPGKAICCVFDMSEANFENVDLELVSWMIKSFKSCSPKLVCYVIVYNLPWFFSATFKLISSTLMSQSNKQSLNFVYGDEILNYIKFDNLPDYLRTKLKSN